MRPRPIFVCCVIVGLGVIGDLDIFDPEETGFCEASQTFSHDLGRPATSRSVFPHALEIAHTNYTRKAVSEDAIVRTLSVWCFSTRFFLDPNRSRMSQRVCGNVKCTTCLCWKWSEDCRNNLNVWERQCSEMRCAILQETADTK